MRVAVVGKGLIGSAAAKYLAGGGHEVIIFGPDEPVERRDHRGVFGSHHDEGRITRQLDPNAFWSKVSRVSIGRYRDIERESGVPFFNEVGALMVGAERGALDTKLAEVAREAGIVAERLVSPDLSRRLPFFHFEDGEVGYLERRFAGHISPRALILAQLTIARRDGAQIDHREVDIVRHDGTIQVGGVNVEFDRVLLAAGCYSQELSPVSLRLQRLARTILFAEIDQEEAGRLANMPSTIIASGLESDFYLLPPICYPDGRFYLKIGGGDRSNRTLSGREEMNRWFRDDGDAEHAETLRRALLERLPGLRVRRWIPWPCVVTFTVSDLPIIDMASEALGIATGGCGRAAKNSDELGRMAAQMLAGGRQQAELSI